MTKTVALESLQEITQSRSAKVDREAGMIRDVKIIGHESANGRTYPPGTLTKARGLYEGVRVNIDHAARGGSGDRQVRDRFGRLVNVRQTSDGLTADLEYLKTHPMTEMTLEVAERMPELLGLSHNAEGKTKVVGGKTIVEEIIKVKSVDLVSDPATTKSLFEHVENAEMQSLTVLAESRDKQSAGDLGAVWLREMMAQGFANPQMQVPAPGNPMMGQSPGGAADAAIKAATKQMIVAVFDDETLDASATLKRITEILQSQERIMGKGGNSDDPNAKPGDESDPTKGGEKAGENPADDKSKKKFGESEEPKAPTLEEVLEENRRLKAEGMARGLLETAGIEATQALIEGVALHKGEAEMKKFIESMPRGRTPGPRSVAPAGTKQTLTESKVPDGSKPDEVAAFLRSK